MFEFLKKDRWSPYIVGALIGVLFLILIKLSLSMGTCCGINKLSALIYNLFQSQSQVSTSYFYKLLSDKTILSWSLALIIGIFLGSLFASRLCRCVKNNTCQIWTARFGFNTTIRSFACFIGGVILFLGTRIAGGCASGHGISGLAQLSVTSVFFILTAIFTGVCSAFILYQKKSGG